jgi:hypothetical protein
MGRHMEDNAGPSKTILTLGGVAVLVGLVALGYYLLSASGGARVSGQLTLDNQPVAGAQVAFLAEDQTRQGPVVTQTDGAGRYQLVGNAGGIPAGKYRVVVVKEALKDGKIPTGEKLEQARAAGKLFNVLPKIYEDRSTTPLQFEIGAGARTIDLALKKKP